MTIVRTTGAIGVNDSRIISGDPPFVVGDPPQWDDASDGTYADLETFEHPDVTYADSASARLSPTSGVTQNEGLAQISARIRYQAMDPGMHPPWVRIHGGTFTSPAWLFGPDDPTDVSEGSQTPTWITIPLPTITPSRTAYFLEKIADGSESITIRVTAPFLRNIAFRTPRTRIYEAHLVVTGPTDAPGCRNYPADTSTAVGGQVRQWPPSKSRQRSSRGVGYY